MSFAEIATPFINLGIPVFPLSPKTKVPPKGMAFLSEATTDPVKVEKWNENNPNYNVALLARNGEFCFLEFDIAKGMSKAAEEMGQFVPQTRTQRSGKGFAHYIFKHTDRSRALGNRSVNLPQPCTCEKISNYDKDGNPKKCYESGCLCKEPHHHHEWFSFRADNKYLVGAGSTHPNGRLYGTYRDVEPMAVPDWVCDYVAKYSHPEKQKVTACDDGLSVDEDFDFDDFCEHYGISIAYVKDDVWHVVEECPGVGNRHEHSTETGFYYDGETLGWSCFAQGCPTCGMSIGQLIKFLNQTHEPYPEPIWPQVDDATLFADPAFPVEYDDVKIEQPKKPELGEWDENTVIATPEQLCAILGATLLPEPTAETAPEATPVVVVPAEPDNGMSLETVEVAAEVAEDKEVDKYDLTFPADCMYGELAILAKEAKTPLGLTYPALIGCYSAKPRRAVMCGTRVNTYVGLIALPESGKNVAIDRSIRLMELVKKEHYCKAAPAGDTQLATLLGDKASGKKGSKDRIPGPKRMLIVNNEMTDVLRKTGVENSTLASRLCDMWDDNEFEKISGKEHITVDCRLSWLGGIPAGEDYSERFTELFGAETNYGLYPRFIFGYADVGFNYKDWEPPKRLLTSKEFDVVDDYSDLADADNEVTVVERMSPEAQEIYEAWMPNVENVGRLRNNLKKVAVLTTSANHERVVTEECIRKAIKFMEWQIKLRNIFQPGQALNLQAKFRTEALKAIRSVGGEDKYVPWRRVAHDRKWGDKYGDWTVKTGIANLIEMCELVAEEYFDENDDLKTNEGRVRINPKLTGKPEIAPKKKK